MTPLAVIIPVKHSQLKSRLSSVLSRTQREEFATLLLLDVLGAFRSAGLIESCHVVSSDEKVLRLASRLGAGIVRESADAGVNAAVTAGVNEAGRHCDILVVPSDLPLLRAADIRRILALRSSGLDVVIAPSLAFNGTNALAFSASSHPALSYDDNSFWNHLRASARRGLSVAVCSERTIMFDVDSPSDLRALARSRSTGRAAVFARKVML